LIDTNALKWLVIIMGIIIMMMVAPPIGVLGIIAVPAWFIHKARKKAAARRAVRNQYWSPDRIHRTYYG
jgi:hypothetical protein